MSPSPTHALLLDLETTGSDPDVDHILEIGAMLVSFTPDLPVIAEANLVVRPPGLQADHDGMWSRMLPVIQEMHSANGLWREATTGDDTWTITEADTGLVQWLTESGVDAPLPIIGQGVGQLDVPFVKRHMPRLASRTTYWPLDFSNIRRGFELAGRSDVVDLPGDVDAKTHRGLEDCRLHILEARRFLRILATVTDDRPLASTLAPRPPQTVAEASEALDAATEDYRAALEREQQAEQSA